MTMAANSSHMITHRYLPGDGALILIGAAALEASVMVLYPFLYFLGAPRLFCRLRGGRVRV